MRLSLVDEKSSGDMRWTYLIRGKEVVLHKLDKGKHLIPGRTYLINIAWADKAGNWNPGGFIQFTTEIKE